MRGVVIIALVLGVAVGTARSDSWKNLDGQKAPEVEAPEWINGPETGTVSNERLKGKVWLLDFMAVH